MNAEFFLTWSEAGSAFFLGIAGALHCAAMCGPLVAAYSLNSGRARRTWLLDLTYHGGRALGYTSVGAACGLAGAALSILGARSGIPSLAAILGGLAMVLFGLAQLGVGRVPRLRALGEALQRLASAGLRRGGAQATFVLGALSAFFPCGLLFAAYARGAATGHPARAAAFMLIFSLSTAPALLVVARLTALIAGRRQRLQRIANLVIIVMGLALIANAGRVYLQAEEGAPPDCPACADEAPGG